MELKDMIMSTLAELEEPVAKHEPATKKEEAFNIVEKKTLRPLQPPKTDELYEPAIEEVAPAVQTTATEKQFLQQLRERVLVLFEGFQAPNNKELEAKLDLTLNFLEYLLASVDERIDEIKREEHE
jgi:hypothetical protein